jgi:hypothetical protein
MLSPHAPPGRWRLTRMVRQLPPANLFEDKYFDFTINFSNQAGNARNDIAVGAVHTN